MQSGLYVNLSGQVALERRLATIANNVANAGTVGYRSEELKFDTVLSTVSATPTAYSTAGESFISERSGGLNKTGNPLDVAVQGKGWLAIQTPAGIAYTRDGRMQLQESGELQTLNGYPILDAGNAPILLDPAAGTPKIARDGMITQNGRNFGALGLFTIEPANGFTRYENSGIIPANAGNAGCFLCLRWFCPGLSGRVECEPRHGNDRSDHGHKGLRRACKRQLKKARRP